MKTEYQEGPEALKRFEDGMKKLFQARKPKESPFKTPAKQSKPSKANVYAFLVRAVARLIVHVLAVVLRESLLIEVTENIGDAHIR